MRKRPIDDMMERNTAKTVKRDVDEDGDFLGYKCPNCGKQTAIEYDGIVYFR